MSIASSRWGLTASHRSRLSIAETSGEELFLERGVEVDSGLLPATLHRPFRDSPHRGDLGEGEPAEELHVHDLGQRRIHTGQPVERLADARELLAVCGRLAFPVADRGDVEVAAALLGPPAPRV